MAHVSNSDPAGVFDAHRARLIRVAYRMLGSVADAEDVLQDAFLRWLDVERDKVLEPAAYLRRVVTRLCLDRLKSVRRERAAYAGPWLPEPVVESGEGEADDVTLPLLMALERLSPLERAAFLLHDVFGYDFVQVADMIDRNPASCRQLAARARAHVHAGRPRYPMPRDRGFEIAKAFFAASREGDIDGLRNLLATDITLYAEGGGKAPARPTPVSGLEAVVRLFTLVFDLSDSRLLRYARINGLSGFVTIENGNILQTTALEIDDGRVAAVYVVRNPDKLRHLGNIVH